MEHASEVALIRAAQRGSHLAFGRLVEGYQARLFRFLRLRSATAEDAEELLQECLLRVWNKLEAFDAERPFAAWLFTVAARLAVSASRRPTLPVGSADDLSEVVDSAVPVGCPEAREERGNLWDLAHRVLSPEARSALWLFYAEGMSAREVGDVLDKREDAVRAMLYRARSRLSAHLTPAAACSRRS